MRFPICKNLYVLLDNIHSVGHIHIIHKMWDLPDSIVKVTVHLRMVVNRPHKI